MGIFCAGRADCNLGEIKFGVYNFEGLVPIMAINFAPPSARDRFNPYSYSVTNFTKFHKSKKFRPYRETEVTISKNFGRSEKYLTISGHIDHLIF